METLATIAVGAAMVIGLVCTVIPLIPGLLIMWFAGVAHALLSGVDGPSLALTAALTLLLAAGVVETFLSPKRGGSARGASRVGLLGGVVGMLVGAVVLPVLGLPIGGVAGVFTAEYLRTRDPAQARWITVGVLRGIGIGTIIEFGLGLVMIGAWAAWLVFG